MATYSKETLGKVLKLFRVNGMQLKINEVAEKTDLNSTYISNVEKGNKNPSLESLNKFSEAYNIPASEIVRIQEETEENNWTDEKIIEEFHEVKKRFMVEEKPKVTIGQILRYFRLGYVDMTTRDLANFTGFSQPYISSIENDSRKPTDSVLDKLSEVFNVPKEEFFKLQELCNENNLEGKYVFYEVLKCWVKYNKSSKEESQA